MEATPIGGGGAFRVWDGEEMLPGKLFTVSGDGRVYEFRRVKGTDRTYRKDVTDRVEVLFATGLADAEGRMIYEADIVQVQYRPTWPPQVVEKIGGQTGFWLRMYERPEGQDGPVPTRELLNEHYVDLFEPVVVGNRHEDPELIDEAQ
jgi:uncharacterized phage protein (TIGR01671 family)